MQKSSIFGDLIFSKIALMSSKMGQYGIFQYFLENSDHLQSGKNKKYDLVILIGHMVDP